MAKIGQMVVYTPTEKQQNQIKKSVVSSVREKYAAVVTHNYAPEKEHTVNLTMFLDGNETMHVKKVPFGDGPGKYVDVEQENKE